MVGRILVFMMPVLILVWTGTAQAFRNCAYDGSGVYANSASYTIGELTFEHDTGKVSGTETTYTYAESFSECHVTYELSGIFEPVSGTLVLDAQRTNHSARCPGDLIAGKYPGMRLYTMQMQFDNDGASQVYRADNGDLLATGDWQAGKTFYRTSHECAVL